VTSEWTSAVINPVEGLLVEWDRRGEEAAQAALSPSWRGNSGLTDGWADVLRALQALQQMVDLPDNELAIIGSVAARIDEAIRRRN
jgi:hypothetical protein